MIPAGIPPAEKQHIKDNQIGLIPTHAKTGRKSRFQDRKSSERCRPHTYLKCNNPKGKCTPTCICLNAAAQFLYISSQPMQSNQASVASVMRDWDPLLVGRVVGDVLDPFTRTVSLRIMYGSREVNNGRPFRPSQLVSQPRVEIGGGDLRTFYTLILQASVSSLMRDWDPLVVGRVVRDVLDPFTRTVNLRILYGSREVSNGRPFRPSQVASKPRVEIGGDDLRSFYTLVMVDPDSPNPSNPYTREYLHWLVIDIPGTTGVDFGQELVSYEIPRPTLGIHRYLFVLFEQPRRQIARAPERRQNFNTRDFAERFDLGSPVAAVYFNGQREAGTGGRPMYN